MRRWQQDGVIENLKGTIRGYYPMSERVFNLLLKYNRLLCVFDGLDELRHNYVEQQLLDFHKIYPNTPLIISYRNHFLFKTIETIDLPRIEMPLLTRDEALRMVEFYETNKR